MAHPNVELALEVRRCINEKDSERASVLAISPKRKGFVIPSQSEGTLFELTPKGKDFLSKWLGAK
jgi:hypothetical protein